LRGTLGISKSVVHFWGLALAHQIHQFYILKQAGKKKKARTWHTSTPTLPTNLRKNATLEYCEAMKMRPSADEKIQQSKLQQMPEHQQQQHQDKLSGIYVCMYVGNIRMYV
jgi:hypothetical protein